MKFFLQVTLCCLLAGGTAFAQRGGGGARGGVGGGSRGFSGGGGFNRGFGGGFRGFDGGRFGFYGGFGFRGGFWPYAVYPYAGLGYGYGYGYGWPYYDPYDYAYTYGAGYASYQTSPNVTVIYPPQPAAPPLSAERARPVIREYDQYGQEVRPNGSPLYLIAFNDHTIRAAASYRIEGNTLHYVTPEREDRQAPLDSVDRALSLQLNRERQVPFQLPPQ